YIRILTEKFPVFQLLLTFFAVFRVPGNLGVGGLFTSLVFHANLPCYLFAIDYIFLDRPLTIPEKDKAIPFSCLLKFWVSVKLVLGHQVSE
ncbi:hypothetical protein EDB92DRAFT_1889021, partial [Lactarius akahatsu]